MSVFPEEFYDAYVLDLDGTLYLGDQVLPGVHRILKELRSRNIPVRFLSNNPTKSPEDYLDKLTRLGIDSDISEIANTVVTATRWIRAHQPDSVVYPIAEAPVFQALQSAGISISDDPADVDIVLASYDRTLTYAKLQIAFDAIWFHGRAVLMSTNPDRYCPFPEGRGEPDTAAVVAAIEACTGVQCERTFGKPNPIMVEEALAGLDIEPARVVVAGDRLATDIAMARRGGMCAALILTGDSQRDDVHRVHPELQPTWVLESIDQLVPGLEALNESGGRAARHD